MTHFIKSLRYVDRCKMSIKGENTVFISCYAQIFYSIESVIEKNNIFEKYKFLSCNLKKNEKEISSNLR